MRSLHAQKIQTRPLWQPVHLSPAHQPAQAFHCDTAERLYRDALSLPCSVGLAEADQRRVVSAVRSAVGSGS
jgi:perosamine synthetase